MKRDEPAKWRASYPFLPPTVPVKDGGGPLITNEGLTALYKLGRGWHQQDKSVQASISGGAAEELAVQAFGNLIASAKTLPKTASVKAEFLKLMQEQLSRQTKREYFYFPVRLFDQDDVATFSIGPITFFRRIDWLDAVEQVTKAPCDWKAEL